MFAELCVVKKPVVFVPFPFAAEDHQTVNAKHLVDKNAALMVNDKDVNDDLVNIVIELNNNNTSTQNVLIRNIEKLAVTNADVVIAKVILNIE